MKWPVSVFFKGLNFWFRQVYTVSTKKCVHDCTDQTLVFKMVTDQCLLYLLKLQLFKLIKILK